MAGEDKIYRFIKVDTDIEAKAVQDKIVGGKLFESLELDSKNNNSAEFGVIRLSELKESVARSLEKTDPFAKPIVIQTGSDFRVIQRILPFDLQVWKNLFSRSYRSKIHVQQNIVMVTKAFSDQEQKTQ